MRRVTRSKYYGRTEVAQVLQSIAAELERLGKTCEYYKFGGKRLPAKLRKEHMNITALWEEVVHMPVTPDEKILAKVKRKKEASVKT